jgi:hypothetical protein
MNLGARSHSGNSPEADAEGWIAFANGRQPQSGEDRPETTGSFGLNGSFPPFDPFLGGNDPFPPEPCRHSLFKKSSPAKKESMRTAGRRAAAVRGGEHRGSARCERVKGCGLV